LSSRCFYAVSPSHNALCCISIRIVYRPLLFLFSIRFPFFRLFETRFVHFTCHNRANCFSTCLPLISFTYLLPFPSSRRVLSIFKLNSYSSASTSTPRCTLRTAMTWIRLYRSMLYDVITSFAVPPYSDSEPAASASFSFSRSSKMLSLR